MASRYRFALSRGWILAHIAILMFVALFVVAGRWQLERLAEKRSFNRTLELRRAAPPQALASLIGPDRDARNASDRRAAAAVAYRRAEAAGTYDATREIVLAGRALNGRPGNHLLTSLVLAPGRAILVDRGWVPFTAPGETIPGSQPPGGRVAVSGVLLPSERGLGTAVPGDAPRPEVSHVDLAKIGATLGFGLAPLYLRLETQAPEQATELPVPVAVAELGEGPHLSYTVQWFLFATIAVVGYAFVLRKAARDRARRTSIGTAVHLDRRGEPLQR